MLELGIVCRWPLLNYRLENFLGNRLLGYRLFLHGLSTDELGRLRMNLAYCFFFSHLVKIFFV
jgi:hypothetical protein